MDFYTFADYSIFRILWLPVVVVAGLGLYSVFRSKQALKIFYASKPDGTELQANVNFTAKYVKIFLASLAVFLMMFALAGPAWNPRSVTVSQKGRDIVVLLDVSNSMMCSDLKPSRLERARIALSDLADSLQGDRIGLVAFAGAPKLICPLTVDYGFFKTAVREVDVQTVQHRGTRIGDAIYFAAEKVFPPQGKAFRDIILITDGEDHDSFPVENAERAYARHKIKIHVVAIGDDTEGARVPVYDSMGDFSHYKKYNGSYVYSKFDEKSRNQLLKVFNLTKGSFVHTGTKNFNLAEIYKKSILPAEKRKIEDRISIEYSEGFQFFIISALFFIGLFLFIPERKS